MSKGEGQTDKQTSAEKSALVVFLAFVLSAVATTAPACDTPERDATIVSEVQPAFPADARINHDVVLIRMTVGENGLIEKAQVYKSSHDAAVDAAAMDAATHSTYLPAIHGCVPYATEVFYRVNFDRTDVTPAFIPPDGWSPGRDTLSWVRGQQTLAVSWLPAYQSLEQQMVTRSLGSAVFLKKERIRLCSGKLDAFHFTARDGAGMISDIVFTMSGGMTYQAAYYSQRGEPPDSAVEQSLLTLCPIRTR